MKFAVFIVCLCVLLPDLVTPQLTTPGPSNGPSCPRGDYHKPEPSAEKNLHACHGYSCNSCCRANITEQISIQPIDHVGNLDYHQCNKSFSDACSHEFSYMECFYQCSPNLYPWFNNLKKVRQLPICASFCDRWFLTCMMDMTCADGRSWITGLNRGYDENGNLVEPCKKPVKCKSFNETYLSAEDMCNNMWRASDYTMLVYTPDSQPCLIPSDPVHNAEVVAKMNSAYTSSVCEEKEAYTDAGMIVGIVFGVLGGLFLIAGGVAFYLKSKQGKGKDKPKPSNTGGQPEEMSTLKVETRPAGTPPNTRDGSDSEEA